MCVGSTALSKTELTVNLAMTVSRVSLGPLIALHVTGSEPSLPMKLGLTKVSVSGLG